MAKLRLGLVVAVALLAVPNAGAVAGGAATRVSSAPWAVVVRELGAAVCSGSIIDRRHVLTAAHCVVDGSGVPVAPSALSVTAGVSNATVPLRADARQDRAVASVRVHPGFRPSETVAVDDVAVVTLAVPFDLGGRAVRAVALPSAGAAFPADAKLRLAGFGRASADAGPDGSLRLMSPVVQPQGHCGSLDAPVIPADDAIVFCAAAAGASVCDGDSGAGLVTSAAAPVLVGIVDSAPAGCLRGTEAVYAFLGAPELREFVDGDDHPPLAPRMVSARAAASAGAGVACLHPAWAVAPATVDHAFVDVSTGAVLQRGLRSSYRFTRRDLGHEVFCRITAVNRGGTLVVEGDATLSAAPRG